MYLIVGCGLSGAVLAQRLTQSGKKVLVVEKRSHIGGNCYDYIDPETGILMNKYGAHLFHTNNEAVWNYVNKFCKWVRWEHKVLSLVDNKYVSIPVNITTVNELCDENIKTTEEFVEWLSLNQGKYSKIENSKEMCISRVGSKLYEKLFKDYTFKQWNKYPEELDASVLSRIPIHHNFDTRYFTDKYQALPEKGYTHFFTKLLDGVEVLLNTDFKDVKDLGRFKKIIYTGPIDAYFDGLEKLEYRSIDFTIERFLNTKFFQPNSVVNYPSMDNPFTRSIEYKHFLNQKSIHTVVVSEKTNDTGEPFYPVPTQKNKDLYEKYRKLAQKEENVYFLGRLADYKYYNMDQAIENALIFFDSL